ncbi:DUF6328 family protein [Streptomyces sp. NPDC001514]
MEPELGARRKRARDTAKTKPVTGTAGPASAPSTGKSASDAAYAELLQEVRVAQTGVQFLLGFLMTFAFSSRFTALSSSQIYQYLLTLVIAFAAAACLTAPAPFHRVVFHHGLRNQLVAVSNKLALVGLGLLMISMSSALLLIFTMVLNPGLSAVLAGATFSGIVWLWFGVPMWHRLRQGRADR